MGIRGQDSLVSDGASSCLHSRWLSSLLINSSRQPHLVQACVTNRPVTTWRWVVVEDRADAEAALVVDEAWSLKKGDKSVGV